MFHCLLVPNKYEENPSMLSSLLHFFTPLLVFQQKCILLFETWWNMKEINERWNKLLPTWIEVQNSQWRIKIALVSLIWSDTDRRWLEYDSIIFFSVTQNSWATSKYPICSLAHLIGCRPLHSKYFLFHAELESRLKLE